jgi:iron(III) transport system ATP-binding protein
MIRIAGISKGFAAVEGAFRALDGVDLDIAAKEFFVLLGPSGSGKTTLLRCVAGVETPDAGEMYLDDRLIFSAARKMFVRPEERGLGMVFQSYAVWPHMTVYQNVALPLVYGARRIAKPKIRDRVMTALALVQMENFADRPVPLLSGGQQQRVALARALAVQPLVLLMDEPLSNLDARLREEVRGQIKEVTKAVGVTVLYVTHDQEEAAALADRIAVMAEGRIVQVATPDELYRHPADPMIADFLGRMNWLEGVIHTSGTVETEIGIVAAQTGALQGPVRVGLRPTHLAISRPPSGQPNEFAGRVVTANFLGEHVQLRLALPPGRMIDVRLATRLHERIAGENVYFRCAADDVLVYPT